MKTTIFENNKDSIKEKSYRKENLLWEWELIEERCNLIEKVSVKFDFIPKVKFINLDNELIYNQILVKEHSLSKIDNSDKLEMLNSFANNLQKMTDCGLIHGDIKRSNVIFDGNKLNLIDWEPAFKQIRRGKKIVLSTRPTRSLNDLKNKTVTSETDKLGFYLFCLQALKIKNLYKQDKDFLKKRKKENYMYTPIDEQKFVKLKYIEIFNKFIKVVI